MESRQRPTRLNVELLDYKAPFLALCQRRRISPSKVFRALVAQLLERDQADGTPRTPFALPPSYTVARGEPERGGVSARPKVPLTASEAAAVEELSAREGLSVPRWIVALIRAYLTRTPQFNRAELDALGQSNLQLLAIGRNLNQIAKALNTSPHDRSVYRVEQIEALRAQIGEHTKLVSSAMAANVDRWRIQ